MKEMQEIVEFNEKLNDKVRNPFCCSSNISDNEHFPLNYIFISFLLFCSVL